MVSEQLGWLITFALIWMPFMVIRNLGVGSRYFKVTEEYPVEEVIEKIISNGGEEFMGRAIEEHGRGKVLETVVEILDRHDVTEEIEKSLLELQQVLLDMAVMVEAQGEQMDDIEHLVLNTRMEPNSSILPRTTRGVAGSGCALG